MHKDPDVSDDDEKFHQKTLMNLETLKENLLKKIGSDHEFQGHD